MKKHNVNPYSLATSFRVNDTNCYEYFGPNKLLGEVVTDDEGAVEIYMNMPEGSSRTMIRGNINFTDASDATVVILICTLDLSE